MKIARIMFVSEVPSPSGQSLARQNWITTFNAAEFHIARQGDTVIVTSKETGRTLHFPWSLVAAAEPDPQPCEAVPLPPPLPIPPPPPPSVAPSSTSHSGSSGKKGRS
jgi:hypothetical protein